MSQPLVRSTARPQSLAPLFRAGTGEPLLAMMLASGGDERIALGRDGRNRYGAQTRPEEDAVWFSSSTASGVSQRGWEAAASAMPFVLLAGETEDWFANLRRRLLNLLAPPGAQAVFCASGTHAEYAALVLAQARAQQPGRKIVNILIGPDETGRGAPLAASGRHFLNSAPFGPARAGFPVDGFGATTLATLHVRDAAGAPLDVEEIDAKACALARVARARGAHTLVHVLDSSKTGLSAISRACAAKLMQENPGEVTVVVDACQLRCPPEQIVADLEAGFLVMISGSKFLGGPAFSGALLVPEGFLAEGASIPWPEGLAEHFALHDWPPALRDRIEGPFGARCNAGLGLRWEAALAELEAFCALDPALVELAKARFQSETRRQILALPRFEIDASAGEPTLIPVIMCDAPKGEADKVLRALRLQGLHLGQCVPLGDREALRLCLSAPQITDFAWRYNQGGSESFAFNPLRANLEKLFEAWDALLR